MTAADGLVSKGDWGRIFGFWAGFMDRGNVLLGGLESEEE